MAFAGVQRTGAVWVGAGSEQAYEGKASRDRDWKIYDLKSRLDADVWYRMRVEADFGARRFKSFTIDGPGLSRTLDLSAHFLDYPNYMPFNSRSMTYLVAAMRGRGMMTRQGTPIVYFDDVEGGIIDSQGKSQRVFFDNFEKQSDIMAQPVSWPVMQGDHRRHELADALHLIRRPSLLIGNIEYLAHVLPCQPVERSALARFARAA